MFASTNHYAVEAYQEDMRRNAEAERLATEAAADNHQNALLATLGRQMVKLGERLQQAETPKVQRKLQPES
jgi:hypothetical protein